MGASTSTPAKLECDYQMNRLKATESLFRLLEHDAPTKVQRKLCVFMEHYSRYQTSVRYSLYNGVDDKARERDILDIKQYSRELRKALQGQDMKKEFGLLETRMNSVFGGAEDRDYKMLAGAKHLLTRTLLLDRELAHYLAPGNVLAIKLFNDGSFRRFRTKRINRMNQRRSPVEDDLPPPPYEA